MLIRSITATMFVFVLCIATFGQIERREQTIINSFSNPKVQWGACPDFIPKGCEIAVLHGDPSKENADVFFKVPATYEIPRHSHTSAERMVLVSGILHVTYDGQKTAILKPDSYAYDPAKPCVLIIAFESAVDALPSAISPQD